MKNTEIREIPEETIKVGSLVELLSDNISEVARQAGWKIGDIAEVIKVDDSDIPYKLKIGENWSWACIEEVRVVKSQEVQIKMREIPEEVYQELVETERKYLILLEEFKKVSKSFQEHADSLIDFFEEL